MSKARKKYGDFDLNDDITLWLTNNNTWIIKKEDVQSDEVIMLSMRSSK